MTEDISAAEALEARWFGNASYKSCDFTKAVQLYTRTASSKHSTGQEKAVPFGNSVATMFFKSEGYGETVDDTCTALKLKPGYVKPLMRKKEVRVRLVQFWKAAEDAKKRLKAVGIRVLYLRSLCTDPTVTEKGHLRYQASVLDYQNADRKEAVKDFTKLVQQYEVPSRCVSNTERCLYIRIVNVGRQLIPSDIQGYVQEKVAAYLMNSHVVPRSIHMSWYGQ